jgi:acyl-CoA reductase-like NAD-dependent aldehyde dehydrogenase
MAQAMLEHPGCRKVHFTGSQRVGRLLMDGASKTVTRLSLELGGNAPAIIFPDVDVAAVAASSIASKFRNCGQVCIAPQRFLVHASIADQFAECAAKQAAGLKLGNGLEPDTTIGPMINAIQRDRLAAAVAAEPGSVLTGGRKPAGKGYFYEPTVIANVSLDSTLYNHEVFGPVMPIATFDDADEAIAYANAGEFGLAAYVWTDNLKTAVRAYETLEYGMIGVNEWTPQAVEAPFTGMKASGMGQESGSEGLQEYLETKLVAIGGLT